ncbi:1-acyl-sn-glycerol-3-phosphate acyltransferase [Alphaproteobacteria bacterium]|jgi:1-acyl-sn-glycerol-3-phosphate acyltransferase|nr:1-acyl-sn-glycerol-3-phosphate acyltransferase [Alphaproteobacteria bacterium]MDB2371220.1 1-acyl-sn-glycerol-3-phosphate acyltransferase [Alphaproteobacteria bacterium]
MRFSFLILFYLSTAFVLIISLLGLPLKYKNFRLFVKFFTKNMQMVLRIFNIKIKVINPDLANLKGCLFASKHQSMFETIYFNQLFYNPAYILKKELLSIPLFGTYLKKLGMIAIDRSQGIQSLRYVNEQTSEYVEKRPVIIFPEGTRTAYKDQPDLKPGIFSMYKSLNKPVVPISLNSGYCWPKNNKIKSGEIIIEFKEPIQPGLSKKEFLDQLKNAINSLNH